VAVRSAKTLILYENGHLSELPDRLAQVTGSAARSATSSPSSRSAAPTTGSSTARAANSAGGRRPGSTP
jgi:hypothetical protein